MICIDFNWIAAVLGVEFQGNSKSVKNINTDTRTIKPQEVFLALKGANFDGHKFIGKAISLGATAVIVSEDCSEQLPADITQFIVADTHKALGLLASAMLAEVKPKTIAITGSVGKTTVKEMTAAILRLNGKVLATKGNFNNDIGVPLTLFNVEQDTEYAVIELGANHIGEIDYTTQLVKPDVAVICNVAASHLEGFGSIEGVAKAKGEIFNGLNSSGIAVINSDSQFKDYWLKNLNQHQVLEFSLAEKKDLWVEAVTCDPLGRASFELCNQFEKTPVTLALPGKHNVTNALTAATLAYALNIPMKQIADGLMDLTPVKGRVNLIKVTENLTVIDDTYNANVQSVKAAIDLLCDIQGHRFLVLGDMGELGEDAAQYHREVGYYAKEAGVNSLYSLGILSRHASDVYNLPHCHFNDRERLVEQIFQDINSITHAITILVKGSRSSAMELLVQDVIKRAGETVNSKNISGERKC